MSPFDGLVFDPAIVGPLDRVTAPPYDVISDARRRECLERSPFNVVRLDLAEGCDDPGNPDSRYRRAALLLEAWRSCGALVPAEASSYFAYEMAFMLDGATRRIRGIFCAMELEDWGGNVIPHERTMPGPLEDRLRLLRATKTQLSAVYGTVAGPVAPMHELLTGVASTPARQEAVDERGVRHRMWAVDGSVPVASWLLHEPVLIADGHHRYTTALHYRDERRANHGNGPWDAVLTLVVDASTEELPVLPFHRMVVTGAAPTAGSSARDLAEVLRTVDDDTLTYGALTLEEEGVVYRVCTLEGDPPTVRALHEQVLGPDGAEAATRFTPDAKEAEAAVRSGEAVAAFILPPTTTERIRAVIEAGERLPEKSTYFWPKPLTGMVIRPLA